MRAARYAARWGTGARAAVLALAILLVGCARHLPELPPSPAAPEPAPGDVESVVFFLGDPGQADQQRYPVITALQRDIERWSEALARDSSVALVVLGDIVYPDGLHSPDDPAFAGDSLHVAAQVGLVAGPAARRAAHGWFVAGNHDWGREQEWEGRDRLRNLDSLLVAYRAEGVPVSLVPRPGQGGPVVVDMGQHLRLLFLDTAWWLLDANSIDREAFLEGLETAVTGAGGRHVVLASHHPYQSAGAHGGFASLWKWFGLRTVLTRSGAVLQDLNSRPYRELREGLRRIGRRAGRPLLHAGGHDHSLQVIRSADDYGPRYSVVAGSASKLTAVGHVEGMRFRGAWPGYARLFVLRNGNVILSMEGAEPQYLRCPDGPDQESCMREGIAAFRTLWSAQLEPPT